MTDAGNKKSNQQTDPGPTAIGNLDLSTSLNSRGHAFLFAIVKH